MTTRGRLLQHLFAYGAAVVCTLCFLDSPAEARVTQIQINSRELLAGGIAFGSAGAYEKIRGAVFFEVDPADPRNAAVFDIDKAPQDTRGHVEFSADFYILKPVDMSRGNGGLFFEVNNRGSKLSFVLMNDVSWDANFNNPITAEDVGNGFLLRQGYTLAWVGWEADVIPGDDLLTVQLPIAMQGGQPLVERILVEFADVGGTFTMPLSANSFFYSYPAISTDPTVAMAQLRVRPSDSPRPSAPDIPAGTVVPSGQWSFANCPSGPPGDPSVTDICLATGFQTNSVYELTYQATNSPVMGLGYLTTRDFVSFLRYATADDMGTPNPVAGLDRALCQGLSQSGRYLRDFLYQGFNEDEGGRRVCDGVNIHIAGVHKLPLNYRFAQPNPFPVQHARRYLPDANFPRTYAVRSDPLTGRMDGILKRPATDPKVFHTVTSTEYWENRASLLDTDENGTVDLADPPNVRRYLFSSTSHLVAAGSSTFTGSCQQLTNPLTNGLVARALLLDLDQWVRNGTAPPDSRVPKLADGTLVSADQASTGFPNIPGVTYNGLFNGSGERNFGPRVSNNSGVIDNLIPQVLSTNRVLVPKVDAFGNDLAGIRQPSVEAPTATFAGWNLRIPDFTDGDLCDLTGMMVPLFQTQADRQAAGDPRLSLQELYGDHAGYVAQVAAAAQNLQGQRLMLQEDVDKAIQDADSSGILSDPPPDQPPPEMEN
jgi:alpha/beta hydrolase family protein